MIKPLKINDKEYPIDIYIDVVESSTYPFRLIFNIQFSLYEFTKTIRVSKLEVDQKYDGNIYSFLNNRMIVIRDYFKSYIKEIEKNERRDMEVVVFYRQHDKLKEEIEEYLEKDIWEDKEIIPSVDKRVRKRKRRKREKTLNLEQSENENNNKNGTYNLE